MEVGNENGGAAYRERWPLVRERHPLPNIRRFKFIANHWQDEAAGRRTSLDEHFYDRRSSFMRNSTHFRQI